MNQNDDFYQHYRHAQQHADQYDRASAISVLAFTLLVGYVIYYTLQFAGLPVEQIAFSFNFHGRRMLARLGLLPTQRGFAGPRRLSTGSQILDNALGGALAPLKAASGDRTLRSFGGLLSGGRSDAPPGMGNWDNSCYQNSVIQGLASLRPVEAFLTKALSKYGKALEDSTNSTLFDTIRQLNDAENNGKVLWTPSKLKSMSTWQQQDAQEYFSKILDEVDKELLRVTKRTSTLPGLAGEEHRDSKDSLEKVESNPLEGFLAQRVACMQCGHSEGLSMIPFNCLTVPLGHEWKYDLSECLEEYTKLEAIEGVECAKCTLLKTKAQLQQLLAASSANPSLHGSVQSRLNSVNEVLESDDYSDKALSTTCQIPKKAWQSTTKSRQAVVARAPKSLVIHINRSVFNEMTGAQTKNYAEVSFPSSLDLGPWCLGKPPQGSDRREDWSMNPAESMLPDDLQEKGRPRVTYVLRAVVTHYGRHENGHYICYRRHPAMTEDGASKDPLERWWRLSDEDVSLVSEEEVLRQGGVFMLFYEQADTLGSTSEVDWDMVASIVPLPDDLPGEAELELDPRDGEASFTPEDNHQQLSAEHDAEPTAPTADQLAQAAAMEASKSSLMAELRAALPSITTEHELTAVGEGSHTASLEDSSTANTSADVTDDGTAPEQIQSLQPLPQAPASGVKMRTAGAGGKRRSNEALDSPLRMASAF